MKNILIFIGIAALVLVSVAGVDALSCAQPGTPTEELDLADAVFIGEVIDIEKTTNNQNKVTFEVNGYWKGFDFLEDGRIVVYTSIPNGAGPGYPFADGQEYVVYAYDYDENGRLETNLCSRTALSAFAEDDLDELGDFREPGEVDLDNLEPETEGEPKNGEEPGKQKENIFMKIISWFKGLFG